MAYTLSTDHADLQTGETLVVLDDDHSIAVSVVPTWLPNGSGVAIRGRARWVDADCQTHLCPQGQHIDLEFTHTADATAVAVHGLRELCREVLLLMLGEEATHVERVNDDGASHVSPMIAWSESVRLNASVRHAISCVSAVSTINAASILG